MFWSPKSIVHLDLDGKYSCIYNYKFIKPMLLYVIQWLNADLNTKVFLKLVESSKDRQSHTIYI